MERYYISARGDSGGYLLEVRELDGSDPAMIAELSELDLLTYSEPTFSRYTLGAFMSHGRVFTIHADGLLIGACHCMRPWDSPDEVVLFNMALRPGWRGHGLGTRFLYRVLERLQGRGTRAVTLMVSTLSSRAIAVYRTKFGFEQVGWLADPYGTGLPYLKFRLDLTRPLAPILNEGG